MTLLATNTTALFLPQDSPLSQVELLTRDREPHDQHPDDWSPPKPASKGIPLARHQVENKAEYELGESKVTVSTAAVQTSGPQQCDLGSQWLPLNNPVEMERHLRDDHQFRAVVIRQKNSHSRLSVSKDLFGCLSSKCGLPAQFQDIIAYFGSRDLEVEVATPRLRFARLKRPRLSASSNGFECMYGLRFVQPNNKGDPQRMYSLRQLAVYNKEDVGCNLATWLLVAPPPNVTIAFNEYFEMQNTGASMNAFGVHALLFSFAISSWRPYLVHLAEEVHQHANTVLLAAPAGHGPISLNKCGDMQRLKLLGDAMLDATLTLSTTHDALNRLTASYTHYVTGTDVQDEVAVDEFEDDVYHQLLELSREVDWLLQQTDGMRQKLLGISHLVSSFMSLGNGRALEDLGKEAREENSHIHNLTKKSTQDAAAVKVLTIMMLVYLPATVVLNFFSTSFVDNTTSAGSSRNLIILANWWIFVAISVPLTVLTFYVWWVFAGLQATGKYPPWWRKIARMKLIFRARTTSQTDEENGIDPVSTAATIASCDEKL
ncbi:hypothetical protein EPUS_06088 [Endocarpon pusillum Z07020]|uniref:CorA-like transporter domain-containing protein n=1 Tax=Endocarpon pusillum (strain Z07020 / HMAS-L-300199) TaxID=1263415 RepID=U1G4T1_ENDPU|nr:uncharacterized protein EPUS_06088 [Endocarpon pusillum Z07020]ERF72332.1 hypothetical protein EPUS_06088 [Endocarpon pusillum Z07020]